MKGYHVYWLWAVAALSGVMAFQIAKAECAQLPEKAINLEEVLNSKDVPFASEGVIYASSNVSKEFKLTITWKSDTPTQTVDFIMVDYGNKNPIAEWPYPLGSGLYVGLTGDFHVNVAWDSGSSAFDFSYKTPMQPATQTSMGPALFSFALPYPMTTAVFEITSENHRAYLICPDGNCNYSQPFRFSPGEVTLVPNLMKGKLDTDGNVKLICGKSEIVIKSHCTIKANPISIRFDDMPKNGIPGTLEQTRKTDVEVVCRSGADVSKKAANIRIYPEHQDASDPYLARFTGADGKLFQGIGLVYSLNEKPTCTGTSNRLQWNSSQPLGEWKNTTEGKSSSGTVYWGLCRVDDSRRDTGEYSTTATISFWID